MRKLRTKKDAQKDSVINNIPSIKQKLFYRKRKKKPEPKDTKNVHKSPATQKKCNREKSGK
jgi:hypothetical protein